MKKIKRRGLYCTKHNQPCEDAYIFINSFKGCEDGIRCNCPKCQFSAKVTEDGTRAIKETPGGFEVAHIAKTDEDATTMANSQLALKAACPICRGNSFTPSTDGVASHFVCAKCGALNVIGGGGGGGGGYNPMLAEGYRRFVEEKISDG